MTLFISSGKPTKRVPSVTGTDQATASAELTAAGFNVASTTETSSTATAGNVISQSPSGGTQAVPGSTVTIVVAKAPDTTAVPSVIGDTPSTASSTLTAAGFTVTQTTKKITNQANDGLVVKQSPGAGTKAKNGSAVTIVVGKFVPTNTTTTSSSTTTSSTTTSSTTSAEPRRMSGKSGRGAGRRPVLRA